MAKEVVEEAADEGLNLPNLDVAKASKVGMDKDKSWNVSVVVETRSQVKHWTEEFSLPSKTSEMTDR